MDNVYVIGNASALTLGIKSPLVMEDGRKGLRVG